MDYLNRIRQILTEGYNFTNADEVISAIKSNQIGVKIQPWVKNIQNNTDTFRGYLIRFFGKCRELGIKDATYGVQLLLSKCDCLKHVAQAVNNDGLYEFLKSYKKPWVKQLPEYKKFIEGKEDHLYQGYSEYHFDRELHALEKAIQDEQNKHGKSAKGSGQFQEAKTLYDNGIWKLMVPTSFEGEKAIAYYGKNEKETPTHWCTRANKRYYDYYTQLGPLYVIRDMKTGKAYQLAFTEHKVEFLDQDDVKGDEVTYGDLTNIPDELLKYIKDPNGSRTLLDYKKTRAKTSDILPKNKISKEGSKTTSDFYNGDYYGLKLGREIKLRDGFCKKEILNYTAENIDNFEDSISRYFEKINGKYVTNSVEGQAINKDKAALYYLKSNPDISVIFAVERARSNKLKRIPTGCFVSNKYFDCDKKLQSKMFDIAAEDFGTAKHDARADERTKERNLKRAKIDRYFDIGDRSYKTRDLRYNTFIDKVNENVDFSNSEMFEKLGGFDTPHTVIGGTVIKELTFLPKYRFKTINMEKGNWNIHVKFIGETKEDLEKQNNISWDKSNFKFSYFKAVPFIKAKGAVALLADYNRKIIFLNEKEFKIAKKAALELQKQILRIPGYKKYNMDRKIKKHEDIVDSIKSRIKNQENNLSKRQINRKADDEARKYVNGLKRPLTPVYESVEYFPY